MSYISTLIRNDEVLVWERDSEGERELKKYPVPLYFFVENEESEDYKSIYGKGLTKLTFDSTREFYDARNDFESSGYPLYESDIPFDLKVLSQNYYNKPAPTLNITFLDIEVDYNKDIGFSSSQNPYAEINSVSLYHHWLDKYVVFAIPPKGQNWTVEQLHQEWKTKGDDFPLPPENIDIVLCSTEKELLLNLIVEIENSDVLSGWNSDFFDMPYIAKRIESVLGPSYLRRLSFPEGDKPKYREVEVYGNTNITIDLSGRISCDYLPLFRKYEAAERPSYKLESIADEIVPELPKLAYDGSLHDLYRNDFPFFLRYNIRDTEILKGFEEKLGYIALANEMYHISTGSFKHVTGTLKLAELAIINYCHHELGLRVPNNNMDGDSGSIQGAYVLEPKTGMHEWIGSIDINSLYPASIRSINISPETLVGQFAENVRDAESIASNGTSDAIERTLTLVHETGVSEEHTATEWREILKERKCAVSGYGTVFRQDVKGIIPAILEEWYATRKRYQKMKVEAKDKDKTSYYDRLQYVYKIKLNSMYGALNNQFFRFYDLRMGESTTGTGRAVLRHQCAKTNELLTGKYDVLGEAIIYGDTDSTYFETWAENEDEAVLVADTVAQKVNESYKEFMQRSFLCTEGFDNIIQAGREVVANRGIFVDKKRYILRVVDSEGKKIKNGKLKVMGLDTKKTTLPKNISDDLNKFVGRLLEGESWDVIANDIVDYKEALRSTKNVFEIGLPKGVKKVEHYTEELRLHGAGTRLPGHIAASIFYNTCLEAYKDKESTPIVSGMKIKVFYLNQKYGRFKSIALPTDLEIVPNWFLEKFTIDRDAHIERLVDKPLGNIIKAIGKDVPSKQSLMVDSLLEF